MARLPRNAGENPPPASPLPPDAPVGERELVVIARPEVALRARGGSSVASAIGSPLVNPLADLLEREGAAMFPLFGPSEERVQATVAAAEAQAAVLPSDATGATPPVHSLSLFYRIEADEAKLETMAGALRQMDAVEAAFVKPAPEPAKLNEMAALPIVAPPLTSDFTVRQGYLMAAPGGVDAFFAHTRPGGRGANVAITDVEGAWRFTHEDLQQSMGGLVGGVPPPDVEWRNHGTAVIGEFGGDRNGFGITGICPDAVVSAVSIFGPGMGSARAIADAASRLRPGDVLLIELHAPGPRFNFQGRLDQRGYIPMEWWPDNLAAIQFAVRRGVIVVEAGGNGAEDLDDPLYDQPGPGFPATWTNPFRRRAVDSGAIVVGAGAPPSGRFGPDRSRLSFSNFGDLMDAQAWGREVVTTGYGDLQGGLNEDLWYTEQFSGTSSASPIVVGALGCIQGILRAANRPALTPAEARALLRSTGSPQQDGPNGPSTQRIGNRPDVRAVVSQLLPETADSTGTLSDAGTLPDQGIETTPFYFVAKDTGTPAPLPVGNYYIAVRLHSAKVIYTGGWWGPVKAVAISTSASFSGGTAPSVAAKNVNTAIRKSGGQGGVGTGIRKFVVMPSPATMETLTLGANFTVTRRDIVNEFFGLAQKEAFSTALGLSAGAVAAVKALAVVIPGLITLFKGDAPEKEDALAVAEDIPVLSRPLRDGYYVSLAAQGTNEEIPRLKSAAQLRVTEKDVELDGKPLQQACHVVLEVMTFASKDIDGSGELWVKQYRQTMKALQDLINGLTPISEKDRILSESLKGLYTVDALQAEDMTFTQRDKDYWRKKLADTYKQAQATGTDGGPAAPADLMALLRSERDQLLRDDEYERDLQLSRQKLAEFSRPATVIVEAGDADTGHNGGGAGGGALLSSGRLRPGERGS